MTPATPTPQEVIDTWYVGKDFTSDWTSWHFPNWMAVLEPFRSAPARILEIGSWEGRSALFFLNYLPQSRLTCVDTFGGNVEHHRNPYFAALVPETERKFDTNLAEFTARIEK